MLRRFLEQRDGFTLVELLVVLAILAVLVGVAMANFTGLFGGATTTAAAAEVAAVQTSVDAKMASTKITTTAAITAATSDMTTGAGGFALAPTYMRSTATKGTYTVDTTGKVTQATTGY